MMSDGAYPSAQALFGEARKGLLSYMGLDHQSRMENMLRMALSPDLEELEIIQANFAKSNEFPELRVLLYNSETRLMRSDYSPKHYLQEFSPTGSETEDASDIGAVERIASQLTLHMWSASARFELTGDHEIDQHVHLLVEFLRSLGTMVIGRLAVDSVVKHGSSSHGNCFIYLVPEDANFLAQGSLLRISGRFEGADRMTAIRGGLERSERNRNGEIGTYSKFRSEYSRVLDWLKDKKNINIKGSDKIIPFTPFHLFGVDGFLVVDASDNLKAAVSMVDCLATGNRKLELVTEGLIRSLGLPGSHRFSSAMSTSPKSRRDRPARLRPNSGPELQKISASFSKSLFFSELELEMIKLLYSPDNVSGMTSQEVLKKYNDHKRNLGSSKMEP